MTKESQQVVTNPTPIVLAAGPLTLQFCPQSGLVRDVRVDQVEVLRGIYAAVRDENWGTVSARVDDLVVDCFAGGFRVSFVVFCRQEPIQFRWQGLLTGDPDGTLIYRMDGMAESTFRRNRIGFCVLHPIRECAGRPCVVEKTDGSVEQGEFPEYIAPHQPFKDVRSITHEPMPGLSATVRFEGDVFEMEDQRNWSDASYKTYCTPLGLPFPIEVPQGTRISQQVTLRVQGIPVKSAVGAGRSHTIRFWSSQARSCVCPVGACASPVTRGRWRRWRLRGCGHCTWTIYGSRCTVRSGPSRCAPAGRARGDRPRDAAADCRACSRSIPRGICSTLGESLRARDADRRVARAARGEPGSVAWMAGAGPSGLQQSPAESAIRDGHARQFRRVESRAPAARRRGNRLLLGQSASPCLRQPVARRDLGDPIPDGRNCPSVCRHRRDRRDADHAQAPVQRGRHRAGSPSAARRAAPQVDPRQCCLFVAAWTLGSIAQLAAAGAEIATYYETTGWLGVMETESGCPLPEKFPSIAGGVFPVYHVFADLAEAEGREFRLLTTATGSTAVQGLVMTDDDRTTILMANVSDERQTVQLSPDAMFRRGAWRLRLLEEANLASALARPEEFRRQRGTPVEPGSLDLPPYGYARLETGRGLA